MKTEGTLIILTPGFAASEEDSTCLPMQQSLVQTFGEIYPQVKIVICSFQYPYCTKTYNWHGATVYSFNGKNRGGLQRLWLRQRILRRLNKIRRREKIIGLLSFWYNECAAVGKLFAAKYNIPHRCWLLGQDARVGNRYPFSHPMPPNELVALSDFMQEEFERNYAVRPLHVITPAINPLRFLLQNEQKYIDLLAAGSLIPLKRYELFVEVVALVKKTRPDVKAVLIGEGPERKRIETLIHQHGLEANIQLKGLLPHKEVVKLMQQAKIFLHPSSFEGFGVVCLEALFGGAQVISFVKPMKREIPCWYFVQSVEEMAEKARQILQNPDSVYEGKLVFSMNETAQKIKELFAAE